MIQCLSIGFRFECEAVIVLNPGWFVFVGPHLTFSDSLTQINLNQSIDPVSLKNVLNRLPDVIFCFGPLFALLGNEQSAELIRCFVNPFLDGRLSAFGKGKATHDPLGFFPFNKTVVNGVREGDFSFVAFSDYFALTLGVSALNWR